MEDQPRQPWDQQPGEPPEAYARFLVYRNLGPARTIEAAYKANAEGRKSGKPVSRSGHWEEDSRTHNWVERSTRWDIHNLTTAGAGAVAKFVRIIDLVALRSLEALEDGNIKPTDWAGLVNALDKLGAYIPAETVAQIRDTANRDGVAAIGTPGHKPDAA